MIEYLVVGGVAAIGLTIITLGGALVIIKIRRYIEKKRYKALLKKKMSILVHLQEELKDREVSEPESTPDHPTPELPPQTPLPADFFEQNYTEVKL